MVNKLTKILPLAIWSVFLAWVGTAYANECNIICNHDGSTVTISSSCDITRTVDCRWNNIKLDKNVIVNIKPGGNLSMDLKHDKIELAPGAKINVDKNSKLANIFVKPYIFAVKKSWEHTMSDMTTPWPRWRESKEELQSWTVPAGVHKITIDFDADWHEEQRYDHVEFRIYKNGSRVYNLRKRGNWSQHVTYSMSVNPGDVIKIWYYEYHDRSNTWGHSHLRNIKIKYGTDKYDAVVKWYIKWYTGVYLQYAPDNTNYDYVYKLSKDEINKGVINNIFSKLEKENNATRKYKWIKIVNGAYKYTDGSVDTTCKNYLKNTRNHPSGYYWIKPGNRVIKAYCDMDNWHGWTFYAVKNGISTSKVSDNNTCKTLWLMLFAPTSKEHYIAGRNYAKSQWMSSLWPLWIYNPTHNSSSWRANSFWAHKPMNSYDPNNITTVWFKSINWWNFWASDKTNVTEPNGDYYRNCWLWFDYDSNLNVRWYNDGRCNYSYRQYLCMAKDDANSLGWISNKNWTIRLKIDLWNWKVWYSHSFKLTNSYNSISDIPNPTQPITVKSFTFSNLNDSSKWNYHRSRWNSYNSTKLWARTIDGNISIYSKTFGVDLQNKNIAYVEWKMKNIRIMDPDCRSNAAYIGWGNDKTNAQIRIRVQDNGSDSWSYRWHDRSLGGRGNFYKLNNFSRGYKQLVIYLRDKNWKAYRYTYSAQSDLPDMEWTMWWKIDFANKKIYFKIYDNNWRLKLDKTFSINLPNNGLNLKDFGTLHPYAGTYISCNWWGVPYNQQQVVPDYVKIWIKN